MTYGERPFWEMANDEVIESISNGLRLPCPYVSIIFFNLKLSFHSGFISKNLRGSYLAYFQILSAFSCFPLGIG